MNSRSKNTLIVIIAAIIAFAAISLMFVSPLDSDKKDTDTTIKDDIGTNDETVKYGDSSFILRRGSSVYSKIKFKLTEDGTNNSLYHSDQTVTDYKRFNFDGAESVYITNGNTDEVHVLDNKTRELIVTIPAGETSEALSFDGKEYYIADEWESTVKFTDLDYGFCYILLEGSEEEIQLDSAGIDVCIYHSITFKNMNTDTMYLYLGDREELVYTIEGDSSITVKLPFINKNTYYAISGY